MSATTVYPPTHVHASFTKAVKPSEAQAQLSSFLELTKTNAYLHPDSVLYVNGPQFSATTGQNGGLALHHLRRIEAGLRGESLVAETADELIEHFGVEAGKATSDDRRVDDAIAQTKGGLKRARSFEKKQKVLQGEVGERDGAAVIEQGGEAPDVEMADLPGEDDDGAGRTSKTASQKANRKADKKARNKARKAGKQAEG
ncbi:hypothetical protein K431DRAFT_270934 [Polychaeton citri CBS 116435]|uniref:Uncharacterized protein n=1 Tax=Polychaeton citri CBS 116435 TaxID=1314669 RepID=A0A9P4Q8P5_9PEZI|nr:hypothetical protein K431DRAFT_270934 [Polychaeton citri CBS 116435]